MNDDALKSITKIAHATRAEMLRRDGTPQYNCVNWTRELVRNLRSAGHKAHWWHGHVWGAHPGYQCENETCRQQGGWEKRDGVPLFRATFTHGDTGKTYHVDDEDYLDHHFATVGHHVVDISADQFNAKYDDPEDGPIVDGPGRKEFPEVIVAHRKALPSHHLMTLQHHNNGERTDPVQDMDTFHDKGPIWRTRNLPKRYNEVADLLIRARLLEASLADGITVQKVSEKPFRPPLGYQGRVTARKHLKFNIVHPQYGVIGEIGGVLHTSRKPKPTMRRDMSDVYAHAWASHKGQPISKGDFDLTAIHLTHHPDTGEKLAEPPSNDADYARIHPHVKNLLGPARLRGVLGQLKRHGIHRVYSTMRTTGVRGVERPRKPDEPISFFEPPRSVVPPFRLREGELVEVWL